VDIGSFWDLWSGFEALWDDPRIIAMVVIGGALIYLGIAKGFEPLLLVPKEWASSWSICTLR